VRARAGLRAAWAGLELLVGLGGCRGLPPLPEVAALAPVPRPADTSPYLVGAYYFPGWPTLKRWAVLDGFPERHPILGYYREGDPDVADWQILWAVEHGISFFVFDWYWKQGQRQLDHALDDGYLRARFRGFLKFALLWANHDPPGSHSEADLLRVVDHWIERYFRQPEYLSLDGRPVVIIFAPGQIVRDLGEERTPTALAAMRARARARGLPDLFLLGVVGPDRERVAALRDQGYDALTGYNYPRAGMGELRASRAPYDSAIAGYEAIWRRIAGFGALPYVPVTEPGWDSRPWHGERLVRTGRHPVKFEQMLRRARGFADAHPLLGRRLVLIEAWNEYGEGAVIEPHAEFGFGYLDAVRAVFARGLTRHRHPVPSEAFIRAHRAE
jgi:hypothetical protein